MCIWSALTTLRAARSTSWAYGELYTFTARHGIPPAQHYHDVGLRLVRRVS